MATFYLTVGVQYAREPHPHGLHPDGWAEIEADSEPAARALAFERYGRSWAFLYSEADFERSWHPMGRLEPAAG